MHTCHLVVLLLVFWLQSIHCNQNAVLDKNYSDRLMKPNNQQSSLQQINEAVHHATVSVHATEPHHTSNVNRLKRTFVFRLLFFGWAQNNIVWSELNSLNQRITTFEFCFFLFFAHIKLDTFWNTHNAYNWYSWQLVNNMRMKDFDEAVAMTAAAVQKLDQLWVAVRCRGTATMMSSHQWIFYGFTFAAPAIKIACTMKGKENQTQKRTQNSMRKMTAEIIIWILIFHFTKYSISFYAIVLMWWSGLFFRLYLCVCHKSVEKCGKRVWRILIVDASARCVFRLLNVNENVSVIETNQHVNINNQQASRSNIVLDANAYAPYLHWRVRKTGLKLVCNSLADSSM